MASSTPFSSSVELGKMGRVTRRLEKKLPNFQRIAPKSPSQKGQNIYNKTQLENPKHLHQTTFKTIRLGWKGKPGKNTPAYYGNP